MAAVPYEGHAAAAPVRLTEGEATRLLYERHQRKILSFCQHQLGNREEAEDATQITFMNAFRGLKRGTSPEFETAWLQLPRQDVRSLSRELVYTALTRAKSELHVCGDADVLRTALARHSLRVSGLSQRLR